MRLTAAGGTPTGTPLLIDTVNGAYSAYTSYLQPGWYQVSVVDDQLLTWGYHFTGTSGKRVEIELTASDCNPLEQIFPYAASSPTDDPLAPEPEWSTMIFRMWLPAIEHGQ